MCLLVNQPASSVFDDAFISGVYRLNSDGLGVMYAENNSLFIKRIVPNNEQEFVDFFRENIAGRDCAWHARMRTHGDTDLANCHPYQVLSAEDGYPLWLAHNGVLHTGNSKDTKYSDTWHFIQDYLRPMLLKNPEFFLTEAFNDMVGAFIGSGNKFVLMDAYGNRVTVNEHQGVKHEGAWLSNTYAWDTYGTVHDRPYGSSKYGSYKPFGPPRGSSLGYGGSFNDDDDLYPSTRRLANTVPTNALRPDLEDEEDELLDFACELFETIEAAGLDGDPLHWDSAENYFRMAGRDQAWCVIEAIAYGSYTQDELIAEITAFDNQTVVAA